MVLNIVMVEPEIPQNAGNVARTCAATGARLHLVGPMGFKIDDKKLKRAGLDYWHLLDITYYDSLDEFFAKNSGEFFFFSTKSIHKHTDIHYPDNCYLFFGKETAGLPEDLLFKNKDRCVRIPMISEAQLKPLQQHRHRRLRSPAPVGFSRAFRSRSPARLRLGRGRRERCEIKTRTKSQK